MKGTVINITEPLRLAVGSHKAGSGKGCAMNVISWENGDTSITDMPACADPFLARLVQRVNDSICTHRTGDLLCPACSVKVLALAHRTVGTAGNWTRVHVQIAIEEAERVLPIFEARYPDDDRPRKAIEAAKRGRHAYNAAATANAASAYNAAATDYAYVAANAASAANAAAASAAAANANYAADAAAYAAADAAYAANATAYNATAYAANAAAHAAANAANAASAAHTADAAANAAADAAYATAATAYAAADAADAAANAAYAAADAANATAYNATAYAANAAANAAAMPSAARAAANVDAASSIIDRFYQLTGLTEHQPNPTLTAAAIEQMLTSR